MYMYRRTYVILYFRPSRFCVSYVVDPRKSGMFDYWRASVASETVLGVDNARSGICYIYVRMDGTYAL